MARKRQEGIFEIVASAPWWVGVTIAGASYVGLKWFLPAVAVGNPIAVPLTQMLAKIAWVPACLFLLAAALSGSKKPLRSALKRSPEGHNFKPRRDAGLAGGGVSDVLEDGWRQKIESSEIYRTIMGAQERAPVSSEEWSLQLLRELEWSRFEKLAADYYEAVGFKAKVTRYGADGGIDAELFSGDNPNRVAILQCKAWNTYKVGVKPVRELFGVMAAEEVPKGIFLTTGEFTQDARDFARGRAIELIDGKTFLEQIHKLPAESSRMLLRRATDGDYTTPTCPKCGIKMTRRTGKNGAFWGCTRYPRCRQTFA